MPPHRDVVSEPSRGACGRILASDGVGREQPKGVVLHKIKFSQNQTTIPAETAMPDPLLRKGIATLHESGERTSRLRGWVVVVRYLHSSI